MMKMVEQGWWLWCYWGGSVSALTLLLNSLTLQGGGVQLRALRLGFSD